jgi:hypothetical protein
MLKQQNAIIKKWSTVFNRLEDSGVPHPSELATIIVLEEMIENLSRQLRPQDHVRMEVICGDGAKWRETYDRLGHGMDGGAETIRKHRGA